MRASITTLATAALALCGCTGPASRQAGPPAAHIGAPERPVDEALLTDSPERDGEAEKIQMPDHIVLPASYRLMLVDGHLTLVRETDPQSIEGAPTSLRIVAGEIARGELSYQPGLLPQELAAEVASNRESSARMDNALASVMQRSRELSEQALELNAQSKRLADLLAAAQARVAELEAAGGTAPAKDPPARPDPPSASQQP